LFHPRSLLTRFKLVTFCSRFFAAACVGQLAALCFSRAPFGAQQQQQQRKQQQQQHSCNSNSNRATKATTRAATTTTRLLQLSLLLRSLYVI